MCTHVQIIQLLPHTPFSFSTSGFLWIFGLGAKICHLTLQSFKNRARDLARHLGFFATKWKFRILRMFSLPHLPSMWMHFRQLSLPWCDVIFIKWPWKGWKPQTCPPTRIYLGLLFVYVTQPQLSRKQTSPPRHGASGSSYAKTGLLRDGDLEIRLDAIGAA